VTSLAELGGPASLAAADSALQSSFRQVFGPVAEAPEPYPARACGKAEASV